MLSSIQLLICKKITADYTNSYYLIKVAKVRSDHHSFCYTIFFLLYYNLTINNKHKYLTYVGLIIYNIYRQ